VRAQKVPVGVLLATQLTECLRQQHAQTTQLIRCTVGVPCLLLQLRWQLAWRWRKRHLLLLQREVLAKTIGQLIRLRLSGKCIQLQLDMRRRWLVVGAATLRRGRGCDSGRDCGNGRGSFMLLGAMTTHGKDVGEALGADVTVHGGWCWWCQLWLWLLWCCRLTWQLQLLEHGSSNTVAVAAVDAAVRRIVVVADDIVAVTAVAAIVVVAHAVVVVNHAVAWRAQITCGIKDAMFVGLVRF